LKVLRYHPPTISFDSRRASNDSNIHGSDLSPKN
jgi:hypothetical protein